MTIALETVLAKAGLRVDPMRFLTLVEDAARRLATPHPRPTEYLTPLEQEALESMGLDLSPRYAHETDSRARAVAEQAVLYDSALTVAEAAVVLDVDGSRIRHRLINNRLMGWKDRGGWRLPAWQFTERGVLPGLEIILAAIPEDQPALVVAAFMTTEQEDLLAGERKATPREWLLAGGDPQRVARLAQALGTPA